MSNRQDFQKFLDKRLKLQKDRGRTLQLNIGGLDLTFIKNSHLERKALFMFKELAKEVKADAVGLTNINLGFVFTPETIEDLSDIIYASCTELKNPELHKELGTKNPKTIIAELFTPIELTTQGFEVVQFLAGINDKTAEEMEKENKKTEKK